MLYPRESQSREIKDLCGIWEFKVDGNDEGFKKKWHARGLTKTMMMPVPSSYNDITQDAGIRDHIGWVWYEKTLFVPERWADKRVVLHVGSATHHGTVFVNGKKIIEHKGGFLPFEADVSSVIKFGEENRVTIAVSNILDWSTHPVGEVKTFNDDRHPAGYKVLEHQFDFFNYSGLHRPVLLIATPKTYIDDVTVTTDIKGKDGIVNYDIVVAGGKAKTQVQLVDEKGKKVGEAAGAKGKIVVKNAKLWQPGKAYLYTLQIKTVSSDGKSCDCYELPVGVRTVKVTGNKFLINGKPFYFKGFGKHEDADIRGKGFDNVINVKDFNLLKWIGANSFRTSHYPYAEEILNMADRLGIVVIDEAPAVGMLYVADDPTKKVFTKERVGKAALKHHLEVMTELINRDKNHPCVVMWSVANEAATNEKSCKPYFEKVVAHTRKLDSTRPVTIVECIQSEDSCVSHLSDVVCINYYLSWYSDPGHLELVELQVEQVLKQWYKKFGKPIIMSEYGADTIAGMHKDPPVMFSEEYQCKMLEAYHKAFDKTSFMMGEHVWNFADFLTKQGIRRIDGNKKGVFTRDRQPKAAAHLLRKRWLGKS